MDFRQSEGVITVWTGHFPRDVQGAALLAMLAQRSPFFARKRSGSGTEVDHKALS